jgi:hypothetical protein
MDVYMTHDHYGRTSQHTNGTLTPEVSSTDSPHPDGTLRHVVRKKNTPLSLDLLGYS